MGNTIKHGYVDLLNVHTGAIIQECLTLIPRFDDIGRDNNSTSVALNKLLKVNNILYIFFQKLMSISLLNFFSSLNKLMD